MSTLQHRLAAILAADAAGYSRLMSIDDKATVVALDAARTVFRERIHGAVRGRVGAALEEAGEHNVKNIAYPVRTYRVVGACAPATASPAAAAAGASRRSRCCPSRCCRRSRTWGSWPTGWPRM